jgi:hypothetical protein
MLLQRSNCTFFLVIMPTHNHTTCPQEAVLCPTVAANSVGKTWASNPDGSDVLYAVGKTNNLATGECYEDCGA